jgi:hypothetical protein
VDQVYLTREEARIAVERALADRMLTAKMSAADQHYFCAQMNGQIRFPGTVAAQVDIRTWTERWQTRLFPYG